MTGRDRMNLSRAAARLAPLSVLTASGRLAPLEELTAEHVSVRDIASHLAKINRFAGATAVPYSVAQHSCLVAEVLHHTTGHALTALHGLVHDAHEAYTGDLPGPVQKALAARHGADALALLQRELDAVILPALGLAWPSPYAKLVAEADATALATELRDLFPSYDPARISAAPWKRRLKPLKWDKAEEVYLETYGHLCALAGVEPRR